MNDNARRFDDREEDAVPYPTRVPPAGHCASRPEWNSAIGQDMDVERDGCAAASVTSTSQRIPATGLAAFAIVARNACGGGGSGGDDTAPPPPPAAAVTSVTLTCTSTELHPSDTSQCTANVQGTGAFCTAVEWSTEGGGEVSAGGSFTAPAQAAAMVTATSVSHPNVSGSVAITVSRPRTLVDLADDNMDYQVHILSSLPAMARIGSCLEAACGYA